MSSHSRVQSSLQAQMVRHKIAFSEKVVNNTALNEEYAALSVDAHSYLLNTYHANVFRQRKALKDFGERVDVTRYANMKALLLIAMVYSEILFRNRA